MHSKHHYRTKSRTTARTCRPFTQRQGSPPHAYTDRRQLPPDCASPAAIAPTLASGRLGSEDLMPCLHRDCVSLCVVPLLPICRHHSLTPTHFHRLSEMRIIPGDGDYPGKWRVRGDLHQIGAGSACATVAEVHRTAILRRQTIRMARSSRFTRRNYQRAVREPQTVARLNGSESPASWCCCRPPSAIVSG